MSKEFNEDETGSILYRISCAAGAVITGYLAYVCFDTFDGKNVYLLLFMAAAGFSCIFFVYAAATADRRVFRNITDYFLNLFP